MKIKYLLMLVEARTFCMSWNASHNVNIVHLQVAKSRTNSTKKKYYNKIKVITSTNKTMCHQPHASNGNGNGNGN